MTRRAVPGTIILPLRECLRHPTQPGRALHGITVLCRRRDPVRTAAAMSRPAAIKAVTSPLARSRCCALIAAAPAWSRAQRRPEFHRHIAWYKPTGALPDEIGQGRHAAEASRPADCAAAQAPTDPTETAADHDPDQGQPAASVQDPRPRHHAARTTASPATTARYKSLIGAQSPYAAHHPTERRPPWSASTPRQRSSLRESPSAAWQSR